MIATTERPNISSIMIGEPSRQEVSPFDPTRDLFPSDFVPMKDIIQRNIFEGTWGEVSNAYVAVGEESINDIITQEDVGFLALRDERDFSHIGYNESHESLTVFYPHLLLPHPSYFTFYRKLSDKYPHVQDRLLDSITSLVEYEEIGYATRQMTLYRLLYPDSALPDELLAQIRPLWASQLKEDKVNDLEDYAVLLAQLRILGESLYGAHLPKVDQWSALRRKIEDLRQNDYPIHLFLYAAALRIISADDVVIDAQGWKIVDATSQRHSLQSTQPIPVVKNF